MKRWQNVGALDRLLRAVAGVVLLGIGALAGLSTGWTVVLVVVAAVLLLTAAVGFCPAYAPLGIKTLGDGGKPRVA